MTDDEKNDLIDQLTGLLGRWVTRGRTEDYDACMTTVAAHIAPETVVKAPEGRMPAADWLHLELHCVYDHWNTYAQLLIGEIVSHIEQQPQQETTANE